MSAARRRAVDRGGWAVCDAGRVGPHPRTVTRTRAIQQRASRRDARRDITAGWRPGWWHACTTSARRASTGRTHSLLHPPHIRDFDKSEWRADSSGTSDRGRSIPDRAARAVLDRTRSRIGRMVELDRARSDSWITGPPPGANPNFRILQKNEHADPAIRSAAHRLL